MSKPVKRMLCEWCGERDAPLKLSNMYIDQDYEVRVICSLCVLRTPSREMFGEDGPKPWPARFHRKMEFRPWWKDYGPPVVTILTMLGIFIASLFVL